MLDQVKLSGTVAIPPNNNSNESNYNTEVEVANKTESGIINSLEQTKLAQFKFKDDYIEQASSAHIADADEIEMCRSVRKLIYPHRAVSKNSEWLTILQTAQNKQGVYVEQCVEDGGKCKFDEVFPVGYSTSCVQRYTYRPMVALVNGELKEEHMKLPHSCKCVLKLNLGKQGTLY
ncbi:PREDICTED: protein spaetzle-like [Bactrocera latifrons]|uniref:protein spaetzle-like n=1 Tax=Bactrocera latifrons TaxID=174628 RepID=UPI0008DC61F7|nr:PREDICTED: protein spaetzle-like [Bactrocera latifrons]